MKVANASLSPAGLIILVTGAGGVFKQVLVDSGVGQSLAEIFTQFHISPVILAYILAVVIRLTQGSATVAMITSVGILGGLATMGELAFHPVYLALIIGCGSKPFQWMNDSGFWVVCTMSGMTEGETLKTTSAVMTIMGFVGLFVVMILAKIFPLI